MSLRTSVCLQTVILFASLGSIGAAVHALTGFESSSSSAIYDEQESDLSDPLPIDPYPIEPLPPMPGQPIPGPLPDSPITDPFPQPFPQPFPSPRPSPFPDPSPDDPFSHQPNSGQPFELQLNGLSSDVQIWASADMTAAICSNSSPSQPISKNVMISPNTQCLRNIRINDPIELPNKLQDCVQANPERHQLFGHIDVLSQQPDSQLYAELLAQFEQQLGYPLSYELRTRVQAIATSYLLKCTALVCSKQKKFTAIEHQQ